MAPLPPQSHGLPRWLQARRVLGGGVVLCLVALLTALGFMGFEAQQTEQRALEQAELQARMLQDHADRTLDTTEAALLALADGLDQHPNPDQLNQRLADLQRSLRFVRSLSLVLSDGQVQASANAHNRGARVDLARLLPTLGPVGPLQTGRDLVDQALSQPSRHSFIPYVHKVTGGDSPSPVYLIAALNPDFFANAYELALADNRLAAALLTYDSQLLAATRSINVAPEKRPTHLPLFANYLPHREQGRYIATGLNGQRSVTAFRSARAAPWVVVVEQPYHLVVDELVRVAQGTAVVLLFIWGAITGLTFLAWRSVRAHAGASDALDAAHQQVARRELELRQLIESVQELMFRTDPQGGITFVNQHWHALAGQHDTLSVGRPFADLVDAGHQDQAQALFDQAQRTGRAGPVQLRLADQAGRRLVEVAVSHLPDGGYAGFALDVTEREAANQAKAEFLANITHELRTPLQSILGFSELGVSRGGATPALHTMFQRIHRAGERMLGLVNNLLDLTRIEQHSSDIALQRLDVRPLVEAVLTELQPLAAARQVTLSPLPATGPLCARIDPTGVQQVLSNVVANAIRFAPSGSAIKLSAQDHPTEGLVLDVRDQGPGIPPAELEQIFEPFVQSSRTKDGSGGTGLGLSICRKIMSVHGGSIRAANHPEIGAIFTLRFPPAPAEVTPGAPAEAEAVTC